MCTAITIQTPGNHTYLGRTMDFSYPLDPGLYLMPKGYKWNNQLSTHTIQNRHSFWGIGQDISPLAFADGVNDAGFAMAALYFPGYAQYDSSVPKSSGKVPIAAIELISFLLGQSESAAQAALLLHAIQLIGLEDSITRSEAPLHWIMADKSGACAVIERTADGLHVMDNPIGVLSNSPDFSWHMTNLRCYRSITPKQDQEQAWDTISLTPFGQGGGTFGLPGDYTPPSRFVRTAYLKSHTVIPEDPEEASKTGFHILESVTIPKGTVITDRGTPDYTQYTAFINLTDGKYWFKTYGGSKIATAGSMKNYTGETAAVFLGNLAELCL